MSLSMGPPEQVLNQARDLVEAGFGTLKLKAAGADDLEAAHLLRGELGPTVGLRVDLNMA